MDPRAVDKAGIHLGLRNPVTIRSVSGAALRYRSDLYDGSTHIVDVPFWIQPESANQKIWHELVHASQQEAGMEFHPAPESLPREEYLALPEEVDARKRTPTPPPFSVVLPRGDSNDSDTNRTVPT